VFNDSMRRNNHLTRSRTTPVGARAAGEIHEQGRDEQESEPTPARSGSAVRKLPQDEEEEGGGKTEERRYLIVPRRGHHR
jgi:hypothetical protein